jgi:alpha-glucosidase (family GH31 glycosyl hydrolase)
LGIIIFNILSVYWFNNSLIYHGGDEVKAFNCPLSEFPVFIFSGSILPLQVDNHYTNIGTKYSKGFTTVLIMQPTPGFHSKNVHEFQSNGYIVQYNYKQNNDSLEVFISAHSKNRFIIVISNVHGENAHVDIARKTSDSLIEFETLEHYNDESVFWPVPKSASMFRKIKNQYYQLFVRVSEVATNGIHLKVKNLKVF